MNSEAVKLLERVCLFASGIGLVVVAVGAMLDSATVWQLALIFECNDLRNWTGVI